MFSNRSFNVKMVKDPANPFVDEPHIPLITAEDAREVIAVVKDNAVGAVKLSIAAYASVVAIKTMSHIVEHKFTH